MEHVTNGKHEKDIKFKLFSNPQDKDEFARGGCRTLGSLSNVIGCGRSSVKWKAQRETKGPQAMLQVAIRTKSLETGKCGVSETE